MRSYALACDYDGTLAHDGVVHADTVAALKRYLGTGRKLILVTGRELDQLIAIFPQLNLFERVVAENGALLYHPATREEKALGASPPPAFVHELKKRGVTSISVGKVIVATWRPNETIVLEAIRDLGLEHQITFNKDAVMVLPSGINKATGLLAALTELGLSPHEVVGVGDAENDHAFLAASECGVAVANALPVIKERVDWVTSRDHGNGVIDLIEEIIRNDLADIESHLWRHHLVLGTDDRGTEVRLSPYGPSVLIAGPSGSGKSTAATGILERLADHGYQYCIIDPEGDYEGLESVVTLGSPQHAPEIQQILEVFANPKQNVALNLLGLPLADRPPFFLSLLPRLLELRGRTGRPHWLIVDEAHHLLPAAWEPGAIAFPRNLKRTIFLTVHPEQVAAVALESIGIVVAVGKEPEVTIQKICTAVKATPPNDAKVELGNGQVLVWSRAEDQTVQRVTLNPCRSEHRRHVRKYAEGEMSLQRSFYFRGPENKLNLRAQNIIVFLQMAEGVDDATWLHHLRNGDYAGWFRDAVKDDMLVVEAEKLQREADLTAADGRARLRAAIERLYTLPASIPIPMPGT